MSAPDQKIAAAAGKAPLWLIAWRCLLGVARVFAYGAKKYKPGNWHEATLADGAAERYISAASRHLIEMQGPNGLFTRESLAAIDESGLPHIDHALCSLIMLRGILIKEGVLLADPGEGKAPATKSGALDDKIAEAAAEAYRKHALPEISLPRCTRTMGGLRCTLRPGHSSMHSFRLEPLPKGPLSWDDVNAHHERPTPAYPRPCRASGCTGLCSNCSDIP